MISNKEVHRRRKILIENGVLKERMHSRETAAIFDAEPNAGMRAITYEFIPLIRMSNTFIAKGDWKKEEIIEDSKEKALKKRDEILEASGTLTLEERIKIIEIALFGEELVKEEEKPKVITE